MSRAYDPIARVTHRTTLHMAWRFDARALRDQDIEVKPLRPAGPLPPRRSQSL